MNEEALATGSATVHQGLHETPTQQVAPNRGVGSASRAAAAVVFIAVQRSFGSGLLLKEARGRETKSRGPKGVTCTLCSTTGLDATRA